MYEVCTYLLLKVINPRSRLRQLLGDICGERPVMCACQLTNPAPLTHRYSIFNIRFQIDLSERYPFRCQKGKKAVHLPRRPMQLNLLQTSWVLLYMHVKRPRELQCDLRT